MPLDDEDEADWIDEPDDEHAEDGTTPCPACGVDMYEDSPRCPQCGEYVTAPAGSGWPLWIVLTALLCLAVAFLAWVLPGGPF
jgi:hypothetical protein